MTDFLPEKYDIPQVAGNYTKLPEGETKLRILSSPIMGYERWADNVVRLDGTNGRGPIRKKMDEPLEVEYGYGGEGGWKHFWSLKVWNHSIGGVQVWSLTQKTIMRKLRALAKNKDWGNPRTYDITVVRTGEGLETEYDILPSPKSMLTQEVIEKIDSVSINLEVLFDGQDPFSEDVKPEEVKL